MDISIFNTEAISTKNISDSELKDNIENSLRNILRHEFPNNSQKQNLKVKRSEFQFACPFCGDSATDNNKKRAHILLDGKFKGLFKCFNCGKSMDINKFFKSFGSEFDMSTTERLIELGNNTHHKDEIIENGIDMLVDLSQVEKYSIDIEDFKRLVGAEEINPTNEAYYYLTKRCQYRFTNFLYDRNGRNLIVLNKVGDSKIIGFQLRDLTGRRQAKYLSYNLERIHKEILKDNVEVPKELNDLSLIFNIFNINVRNRIIVTEGPMDAFLVHNAVASAGANKNIPLKLQFCYLYDDDETGRKHAIEKINEGQYVFMWDKLKSDLGIPDKKKWDVNDIIVYLNSTNRGNIKIPWSNYFSNDMFDIINI